MQKLLDSLGLSTPEVSFFGVDINSLWLVIAILLGCLVVQAMRARGVWTRWISLGALPTLMLLVTFGFIQQLSFSKPLSMEWLRTAGERGLRIHHAEMRPPRKIHVLVDVKGNPRLFWIPWSKQMEDRIRKAIGKMQRGEGSGMILRFQPSLKDALPQIDIIPWPRMPRKDEQEPAQPFEFDGRREKA